MYFEQISVSTQRYGFVCKAGASLTRPAIWSRYRPRLPGVFYIWPNPTPSGILRLFSWIECVFVSQGFPLSDHVAALWICPPRVVWIAPPVGSSALSTVLFVM